MFKKYLILIFVFITLFSVYSNEYVNIPGTNITLDATKVIRNNDIIFEVYFSEDFLINTIYGNIPIKSYIHFYQNGKIEKTIVKEDISIISKIGNLTIQSNSEIEFYENGGIKSCTLKHPVNLEINNAKYQISSVVNFYNNGLIKNAKFINNQSLKMKNGILNNATNISFFYNGQISNISFSNPSSVVTKLDTFSIKDSISFFQNGNIEQLILANEKEIEINLGKIKIYKIIFFDNEKLNKIFFNNQTIKINTQFGTMIAKSEIEWDTYGNIQSLFLAEPFIYKLTYGHLTVTPNKKISLPLGNNFEDYSFVSCAEDRIITWIGEVTVPIGTDLYFKNGLVWGEWLPIAPIVLKTNYGIFNCSTNSVCVFSCNYDGTKPTSNIKLDFINTETIKSDYGVFNSDSIEIKVTEDKYCFSVIGNPEISTSYGKLSIEKEISFYEDKKIASSYLKNPIIVSSPSGVKTITGKFALHNNSNFKELNFLTALMIDTPLGKYKTQQVCYYPDKSVESFIISDNKFILTKAGKIPLSKNQRIAFYQNGKIKKIELEKDTKIYTKMGFQDANNYLEFDENENLITWFTAKDFVYKDVQYNKDQKITTIK